MRCSIVTQAKGLCLREYFPWPPPPHSGLTPPPPPSERPTAIGGGLSAGLDSWSLVDGSLIKGCVKDCGPARDMDSWTGSQFVYRVDDGYSLPWRVLSSSQCHQSASTTLVSPWTASSLDSFFSDDWSGLVTDNNFLLTNDPLTHRNDGYLPRRIDGVADLPGLRLLRTKLIL